MHYESNILLNEYVNLKEWTLRREKTYEDTHTHTNVENDRFLLHFDEKIKMTEKADYVKKIL